MELIPPSIHSMLQQLWPNSMPQVLQALFCLSGTLAHALPSAYNAL